MSQEPAMRMEWRLLALAGIGAAGALTANLASAVLLRLQHGSSTLWLASPVLLMLLLEHRPRPGSRRALLLGHWLGSLLAYTIVGLPLADQLVFPLAGMAESVAAAALLLRIGHPGNFARVIDVVLMMGASAVAPLVSALIAGPLLSAQGHGFGQAWLFWYRASALSMAIVTPCLLVMLHSVRGIDPARFPWRKLARAAATVAMVAGVATLVFSGRSELSLYTIMPVALIATFRFRQAGSVGVTLAIALVAIVALDMGVGPIAAANSDPVGQGLTLQLFLAVMLLTLLPVSAMLNERDARAAEARMLASQLKAVVDNVRDVIFRVDPHGRWTYLNPAWDVLSGRTVAESLGASWLACMDDEDDRHADWAEPVLHGSVASASRTLRFRMAGGETGWVELSMERLLDGRGQPAGAAGTLRDITDRKRLDEHVLSAKRRAEERAREATALASTDELTGLANRRAFLGRLEREVALAAERGHALTVAMLDVDHFKTINDRFGHAAGDRVLQEVAARAQAALRGDDLVGRIGGEEFAVVMPKARLADAGEVAERLRHAIERATGGDALPAVTVSVGLASLAPGDDAAALLRAADRALYEAKDAGRNRVQLAA